MRIVAALVMGTVGTVLAAPAPQTIFLNTTHKPNNTSKYLYLYFQKRKLNSFFY